jgi:fucose 4-O-acetylase-like acetyltransferase
MNGVSIGQSDGRIAYWDNIKGILIFLVVAAHFAMPYATLEGFVWACYLFHMPAFLFVSGYFSSRNSLHSHKVLRLVCLFFAFNTVLMIGKCGINPANWQWFSVHLSAWYLLALILYRFTVPFLDKVGIGKAVVFSHILGLIVGLVSPKDAFCLYKIIPLYPFLLQDISLNKEAEN